MDNFVALDEVISDSELHHINFFNGRLLTGGDLEAEQGVQHAHSRRLGKAIGEGVVFGLHVTPANTSPPEAALVNISDGLAVNRAGQTLRLECSQQIALTRVPDPAAKNACVFNDCEPAAAEKPLRSGAGYYLLTIGPASRPEGTAPVSGLGNTTAICNSRFFAEGVRFRLFRLNLPVDATPLARSRLARACFGIAPNISDGAWPSSLPGESYGWETLVPPAFEREREVPLAVLEWSDSGIKFLRRWPVRRRIASTSAVDRWRYFSSDRRVAEGEAIFLDFQDELAASPADFAGNHFAFLPAGGILPARSDWNKFLGALAPSVITPIDASLWARLLRDTFTREPVTIPAADATTFNTATFAAIKVYQAPGRAELLFARSTLGRLRLFLEPAAAQLQAVLVRAGDGSIRTFQLTPTTKSPLIVDDLPGPEANLWLVRATLPQKPEPRDVVGQALIDFDKATEKAKRANAEYKQAQGVTLPENAKTVSSLAKGVQSSVDAIDLGQKALFAQADAFEARLNLQQALLDEKAAVASGTIKPDSDFYSRFIGTPDLTEMLRLAPTTSIISQGPVPIVHGRTTDLRIPPPSRPKLPREIGDIVGTLETFHPE